MELVILCVVVNRGGCGTTLLLTNLHLVLSLLLEMSILVKALFSGSLEY